MALAQKGIDVRQTGTSIVFRAFLQTTAGALLGTGTTVLSLLEVQSDGTIKSYDFNDNTFKTTALTTPTLALTHRPSNNATTTTGYWTVALNTVTGFTVGGIYAVIVNNTGASPTDQMREFQYGSAEGDLKTTANGTGVAELNIDLIMFAGTAITDTSGRVAAGFSTFFNIASPTSTMNLITGVTTVTSVSGSVGSVTGAVGSVTGAVGSVTGNVGGNVVGTVASVVGNVGGNVTGSVGSVVGLTAANLDATVSSRLATVSYTAPDNATIATISGKVAGLTFTVGSQVDCNVHYVNNVQVKGVGTAGSPWNPV